MVDTPVAVMSIKRARESKCTNIEYNIVYVLNNIMVMTCRYIHDYYVNDIYTKFRS